MSNIRILDCTLRDGGYINNWQFSEKAIKSIIRGLSGAGIDIIECGFLKEGGVGGNQTLYGDVAQIKHHIGVKLPSTIYVAMIAYGDMGQDAVTKRGLETIDGIRLTFHNEEWEATKILAQGLIEKGYLVFIQPVGTISYSDQELLALIHEVNALNPYAFYLVDTLGSMYQNDLLRMFYLVDHNLNPDICIGFHSHNNLQLAFSNALSLLLLHTKREIIIDSSVFGMGRAAGNLCTELVAQYINNNVMLRYNITSILEIMDHDILPIYAQTPWGYSVPMFLAATQLCHPDYVSYLINKQTIAVQSIQNILDEIPKGKRHLYDKQLIEKLYLEYQSHFIDDSATLQKLSKMLSDRHILLLAPGMTIHTEREKINKFIGENNPFVIAVNFVPDFPVNYVFISNARRLDIFADILSGGEYHLIVTSNLSAPKNVSEVLVVNYSSLLNQGEERDNAGLMVLELMTRLNIKTVALAGFDGFTKSSANYFSEKLLNYVETDVLINRNESISQQIRRIGTELRITFLTTSAYRKTDE
jgi:4-hydroxy 2-oxovalerate aldolase